MLLDVGRHVQDTHLCTDEAYLLRIAGTSELDLEPHESARKRIPICHFLDSPHSQHLSASAWSRAPTGRCIHLISPTWVRGGQHYNLWDEFQVFRNNFFVVRTNLEPALNKNSRLARIMQNLTKYLFSGSIYFRFWWVHLGPGALNDGRLYNVQL